MPATPITNPIQGESLLGIDPQLEQQVDPGWRHRLNLYNGRALTDTALDGEQSYRAGLLATLAQAVTPGTVKGLVLSIDTTAGDPVLTVTPGYGIAASGEDVNLLRTMQTHLSTIAVADAATGDVIEPFGQYMTKLAQTTAGILLFQPIVAQVSGQAFDTGTAPIEVSGNLGASCDQDPDEYAFEDWQIADGARLVYLPWISGVASLALPDANPVATWRNRIAYAIFTAEAQLGLDAQFPWMMLGVPLALAAFDSTGKPLFVDRAAVVRPGGLPRRRHVLPAAPQTAPFWQPNTQFGAGFMILDSNGNVQRAQVQGKSSGTEPTWSAAAGSPTHDNEITWVNGGSGSWQPNAQVTAEHSIFDSNGNLQTVLVAGVTGPSEPDWNDLFLQTADNGVTWVNNGVAVPPIVQPSLAAARLAQLAEQVGDQLSQSSTLGNLAQSCTLLPPSAVLPVAAVDLAKKTGVWLPPNWVLTAAPVHLEELDAALQTGMLADPIAAESTAPSASSPGEAVEVLVPLPDQLYDPDILVTETVVPDFQREIDKATQARNATLRDRKAVQLQLNALNSVLVPSQGSTIDLGAGLTPAEIAGRDTLPPIFPQPGSDHSVDQTFGSVGPASWQPNTPYILGQFVIDSDGNIQQVQNAGGTSGPAAPVWNPAAGGTTTDGATDKTITWFNNGTGRWSPNTAYAKGQFIFDESGCMQVAAGNGTSGPSEYIWNLTSGGTTTDSGPDPNVAGLTWVNDGPAAWQAGHTYSADQVVIDSNGNLQVVQTAGQSGGAPPIWETDRLQGTSDNTVVWINEGPPTLWEPNTPYALHQCLFDPNGNVQEVQTAGTSGASQLIWNPNSGETTTDNAGGLNDHPLQWVNAGPGVWQPLKIYAKGQFVLDSTGNTQIVQTAGRSGSSEPAWNANAGQNTPDSGVTWNNTGTGTWQPNATYSPGQFVFDGNGNVQTATMKDATQTTGVTGGTQPAWSTSPETPTTPDGTIVWVNRPWASADAQGLRARAGAAPFTTTYTDASQTQHAVQLFSADDWTYLDANGLQSFIDLWNGRIKKANDLLDLAFLTTQTDIYRFRQNVLTTTDASRLATSPVLANIATGDSASATALQVQNYYANINPSASKFINDPVQPPQPGAPAGGAPTQPSAAPQAPAAGRAAAAPPATSMMITRTAPQAKYSLGTMSSGGSSQVVSPYLTQYQVTPKYEGTGAMQGPAFEGGGAGSAGGASPSQGTSATPSTGLTQGVTGLKYETYDGTQAFVSPRATGYQPELPPAQKITQQAPVVGGQLDVRTLTIAARLAQSPSQESMFYAVANRSAFMQALALLEVTTDDLPFFVDGSPLWQANTGYSVPQSINDPNGNTQIVTKAGTSGASQPAWSTNVNDQTTDGDPNSGVVWTNLGKVGATVPTETHFISEIKPTSQNPAAMFARIQTPYVHSDIDEAGLFSVGVRVVEQHTQVMRALEARVQTYVDFITLCGNALANVQNNVQIGQTLLKRLDNDLAQKRQDLAFTTALLGDERQRVATVNAQRDEVLQTSVQFVAYTRPRSLQTTKNVPSRQLVPGNVASPVPTCLQQTAAVPPELREIVALLSDAPVSWFPSVAALVRQLDRPPILFDVANDVTLRAATSLQMPPRISSAVATPTVYSPAIAGIYAANQQLFRGFQVERAAYQPAGLASVSWTTQVATLTRLMGVGDLTSSESVHAEVVNATARILGEISSVAGCVYSRANAALPVERLAWAEFLTGPGLSAQLRNLAVLPNWNTQPYADRQQMQLLVDWLFGQIDTSIPAAVSFMSDVVRVCILLASHAPVNDVIAGAVQLRTAPSIGGLVKLTLPSTRVAAGMYVQLYSKGNLAAEAVVSDLDSTTVSATVTNVHQPGVFLEANDVAHFTSQPPQAAAMRAFAG